jgi:hypothetical protein
LHSRHPVPLGGTDVSKSAAVIPVHLPVRVCGAGAGCGPAAADHGTTGGSRGKPPRPRPGDRPGTLGSPRALGRGRLRRPGTGTPDPADRRAA